MANIDCPFAVATGTTGLYKCSKPEPVKATAKRKKNGAKDAAGAGQSGETPLCGHQRYCSRQRRCVLTDQAAICPKREK